MIDSRVLSSEVARFLADLPHQPFDYSPSEEAGALLIQLRLASPAAAVDVAEVLEYLQGVTWGVGTHLAGLTAVDLLSVDVIEELYRLEVVGLADGSLRVLVKLDPRNWGRHEAAFLISGAMTVAGQIGGWSWVSVPIWAATALTLPSGSQHGLMPAPLGSAVEVMVSDESSSDTAAPTQANQ